jgi:hypothetical protein
VIVKSGTSVLGRGARARAGMARLYAAPRSVAPRATPQPPRGSRGEESHVSGALGATCASGGDTARHTALTQAPHPSPTHRLSLDPRWSGWLPMSALTPGRGAWRVEDHSLYGRLVQHESQTRGSIAKSSAFAIFVAAHQLIVLIAIRPADDVRMSRVRLSVNIELELGSSDERHYAEPSSLDAPLGQVLYVAVAEVPNLRRGQSISTVDGRLPTSRDLIA